MKTVYAFLVVMFAVLHLSLEQSTTDGVEQDAREKRQRGWSGMKPDYHMESYRSLRSGLNNATQFLSTNLDDLKFKALEAIEDVFFVTPRGKQNVELIKDGLIKYSTGLLNLMENEKETIEDRARDDAAFNKELVESVAARIKKNSVDFENYLASFESTVSDRMLEMLEKLDAVKEFSEKIRTNLFGAHKRLTNLKKAAANRMLAIAKQIYDEIKGVISYSYTRIELLFTHDAEDLYNDMETVFNAFIALNKTTNQNKEDFLLEFYEYYDPAHEKYAEKVQGNVFANNLEKSIEISTEVLKEKIRIVKYYIQNNMPSPNDEEFWFSTKSLTEDQPSPGGERPFKRYNDEPNYYYD